MPEDRIEREPPVIERQPGAARSQKPAPFAFASPEARALAAQMAAAGSAATDIERRLRDKRSIGNPAPIADEAVRRFGS